MALWGRGKFKSFNFTGFEHLKDLSETSGLGVGLSTASTLAKALGGFLMLTSGKNKTVSGTEAIFTVITTKEELIESYQEDL